MGALSQLAIRYPRATIATAVAVTLAFAPGILRLRLRTDGHALVPADAPAVRQDAAVRQVFGLDDPIVVVVHSNHPAGIFNAHTVALVDQLTKTFQRMKGVRPGRVLSLATESSDRVWTGTLRFRRLLEPLPQSEDDLKQLRRDLLALQLYNGTFASKDFASAAILVGAPAGEDRLALLRRIQAVIDDLGRVPERIQVIGAPVAEALLGTHILEDLGVPAKLLGHQTFDDGTEDTATADAAGTILDSVRLWIARTIGLAPAAIVIIALVFLICFRSVVATLLPLAEVAAAMVFVFGLMGWLDVPIYLTTAILPIILTATGITDEIHVFTRYRQILLQSPDQGHLEAARQTMEELTRPIVMTALTTAIGFLSFGFSSLGPVQAFGLFTGVGGLFCMLWSITVVPASFVLLSPAHFASARARASGRPAPLWRLFHAVGRVAARWRIVMLALSLAAVALTPLGLHRVFVQDSWIDGFSPGSSFHRATQEFNDQFLGMHELLLSVDAGSGKVLTGQIPSADIEALALHFPARPLPDPAALAGWHVCLTRSTPPIRESTESSLSAPPSMIWSAWIASAEAIGDRVRLHLQVGRPSPVHMLRLKPGETMAYELSPAPFIKPEILERVRRLEAFIGDRREDTVGGVLGPYDYVSTVNYMIHGRRAKDRRVPEDYPRVERCWREYIDVRGQERMSQLIDGPFTRGVITILLKNANFVDTTRLVAAIRDYEAEHLAPVGISLTFAGDVAVSQALIEAIVRTQVQSIAGTLLGVFVVSVVLGRSIFFGLVCIVPSLIAVLVNYAVMGWMEVPLGVATSMFSAMTIGIGVDYAIHLQARYRRLRTEAEAPMPEGTNLAPLSRETHQDVIARAVAGTGPAILVDTIAVALGFGILTLSQVPANARLGALVALSIVNCFAVTVLLLPAFLACRTRQAGTATAIALDDRDN